MAEDAARFVELLREEESIYGEVLELARKQSALVEGGQAEELLTVLAAKGELIGRLTGLGSELGPMKESWKASRDSLAGDERAGVEGLLASITELLEKIIAEENAAEELIGRQRTDTVERIKDLQKGRQMNKAYGDRTAGGGRFTDTKR